MAHLLHKRDVRHMADIQRGQCVRCSRPLNMSRRLDPDNRDAPSQDHVIPKCDGGLDQIGNLTIIHRKCNDLKGEGRATGCEVIWAAVIADVMRPAMQIGWRPGYRIEFGREACGLPPDQAARSCDLPLF